MKIFRNSADPQCVLEVACAHAKLSDIIAHAEFIKNYDDNIKEIHIQVSGDLILDRSVYWPGTNLVIDCVGNIDVTEAITINLSGLDAVEHHINKARSGTQSRLKNNSSEREQETKGTAGENGLNGAAGQSSGNIDIRLRGTLHHGERLTVILKGGRGAAGQDGGDGEPGTAGKDGNDSVEADRRSIFRLLPSAYVEQHKDKFGKVGGRGGNGGAGGLSGEGGYAGEIFINDKADAHAFGMDVIKQNGMDGVNGKNGQGGVGGQGGRTGCDYACEHISFARTRDGFGEFKIVAHEYWIFTTYTYQQIKTVDEVHAMRAPRGENGLEGQLLDKAQREQAKPNYFRTKPLFAQQQHQHTALVTLASAIKQSNSPQVDDNNIEKDVIHSQEHSLTESDAYLVYTELAHQILILLNSFQEKNKQLELPQDLTSLLDSIKSMTALMQVMLGKIEQENQLIVQSSKLTVVELKEILTDLNQVEINEDLLSVLQNMPITQWHAFLKKIYTHEPTKKEKITHQNDLSVNELLDELELVLETETSDKALQALFQQVKKINEHFDRGCVDGFCSGKQINELSEKDIKQFPLYLQKQKAANRNWLNEHAELVIAVIMRGIQIIDKVRVRNTQLIALCLYLDAANQQQNRLGQVATGEGKSLMIAMFAMIQGLQGNLVNIITVSAFYACRDASNHEKLFNLFGLAARNNCDAEADENLDVRRERYTKSIVYGDIKSFERDSLLTNFYGKNIVGNRTNAVTVVDEADSILIDKIDNTLYLSHEIPDLRHLIPLYLQIWYVIHFAQFEIPSATNVGAVTDAIQEKFANKEILIPACFKTFVAYRLKTWIEMAYQAKVMSVNGEFVLSKSKSYKNKRLVVIMDNDTGVEQKDMQWDHGLHQFVQLASALKVSKESLKAIYLSNVNYFQICVGRLYGVTATLGAESDKVLLRKLYQVDFFKLPRFKQRHFTEESAIVVADEAEWLKQICEDIRNKIAAKRSVLIICQDKSKAKVLKKYIQQLFPKEIIKYSSADKVKGIATSDNSLPPGKTIIATNLAGRAADLFINDALKNHGGLHVILSVMAKNIRIEEQDFGRAARKGEPGSGRYIVCDPLLRDIETLRHSRDCDAAESAEYFRTHGLQAIEMEKILFELFTKTYQTVEKELKDKYLRDFGQDYVDIQLACLNTHWAFWLDQKNEIIQTVTASSKEKIIADFQLFHDDMLALINKDNVFKFAMMPHDLTRLGKHFCNSKQYDTALACFDKVIADYPDHAEIAYRHKVYVIGLARTHDAACRKDMKRVLQNEAALIQTRIAANSTAVALFTKLMEICRNKGRGQYPDDFEQQMQQEIELYGRHLGSIQTMLGHAIHAEIFNDVIADEDKRKQLWEALLKAPSLVKPLRVKKHANELLWSPLQDKHQVKPYKINYPLKEIDKHNYIETRVHEIKAEVEKAVKAIFPENAELYSERVIEKIVACIGKLKSLATLTLSSQHLQKYFSTGELPPEILQFTEMLFDEVLVLDQVQSRWDWNAFAVAMLGVAQIAAGLALELYVGGFASSMAGSLISEGISDLIFATQSGLTHSFSWSAYGWHKLISLSVSASSLAIGGFCGQLIGGVSFNLAKIGSNSAVEILSFAAKRVGVAAAQAVGWKLAGMGLEKFLGRLPHELKLQFGVSIENKIINSDEVNVCIKQLESTMASLFVVAGDIEASLIINKIFNKIYEDSQGNSFLNRLQAAAFSVVQEVPSQILLHSSLDHATMLSLFAALIVGCIEHTVKFIQLKNLVIQAFKEIEKELKQQVEIIKEANPSKEFSQQEMTTAQQAFIGKTIARCKGQLASLMLARINAEVVSSAFTKAIQKVASVVMRVNSKKPDITPDDHVEQRRKIQILQQRRLQQLERQHDALANGMMLSPAAENLRSLSGSRYRPVQQRDDLEQRTISHGVSEVRIASMLSGRSNSVVRPAQEYPVSSRRFDERRKERSASGSSNSITSERTVRAREKYLHPSRDTHPEPKLVNQFNHDARMKCLTDNVKQILLTHGLMLLRDSIVDEIRKNIKESAKEKIKSFESRLVTVIKKAEESRKNYLSHLLGLIKHTIALILVDKNISFYIHRLLNNACTSEPVFKAEEIIKESEIIFDLCFQPSQRNRRYICLIEYLDHHYINTITTDHSEISDSLSELKKLFESYDKFLEDKTMLGSMTNISEKSELVPAGSSEFNFNNLVNPGKEIITTGIKEGFGLIREFQKTEQEMVKAKTEMAKELLGKIDGLSKQIQTLITSQNEVIKDATEKFIKFIDTFVVGVKGMEEIRGERLKPYAKDKQDYLTLLSDNPQNQGVLTLLNEAVKAYARRDAETDLHLQSINKQNLDSLDKSQQQFCGLMTTLGVSNNEAVKEAIGLQKEMVKLAQSIVANFSVEKSQPKSTVTVTEIKEEKESHSPAALLTSGRASFKPAQLTATEISILRGAESILKQVASSDDVDVQDVSQQLKDLTSQCRQDKHVSDSQQKEIQSLVNRIREYAGLTVSPS